MKRHFYISDNLDDLEALEKELEDQGLSNYQIHVLSQDEAGLATHHLHAVADMMKRDLIHATLIGAGIGLLAAALVLLVGYYSGATDTVVGWLPFGFLAVVAFGFCTWEGGLFGIQEPNIDFEPFHQAIAEGKHVFFVDVSAREEKTLANATRWHPKLRAAGEGRGAPDWLVNSQKLWHRFVTSMP